MCGRYSLYQPLDALAIILDLESPGFEFEPRYNAAPTQILPIILNESPHQLSMLRWGLIPSWAKDRAIGNKMLNARAETVLEKPAFRNAFQKRRCLIPVNGFYEWKKTPHGKIPHHITHTTESVMTFAGLWEFWHDPEGRELRTFTILTTEPNEIMAPIHDRMPVIISPADRAKWLDSGTPIEELVAMLKPCPANWLKTDEVSTLVNSPAHNGPEILEKNTLF